MDGDRIRKNYLNNLGINFNVERKRRVLEEICGLVTFKNVLNTAVKRCKARDGKGQWSLYNTWHQHVGTIDNVWKEFRIILDELMLSEQEKNQFENEMNQNYGTGASLYFD